MRFRYPVALELEGRPCVVIGGGAVAEQKVCALLAAGASITVVSDRFTSWLEELARRREVALVRRPYGRGDLAGAFLAVAATDDGAVNAEVFEEAESERVLLNAVDDVEHCHFAVPSVVRRGDLTVAISTGGRAPALAKRLRRVLLRDLGPEYATLVELLGAERDEALGLRADMEFQEWAGRWREALDEPLVELVREGRVGQARAAVRARLEGRARAPDSRRRSGRPPIAPDRAAPDRAGKVFIVGAGPGDPGLITVRGREVLELADVVVHDRLVHPALLEGKRTVDVGKEAGRHGISQEEINALLVRLAAERHLVVRLKGGDPFVFGRGAEEAEALARAGVEYEVVPGPTSAVAALAAAGIPVTDRRAASSFAVVTGHCTGGRSTDWRGLASAVDTVVVLMPVGILAEVVAGLLEGGRSGETPAAVVEDGTLPTQRVVEAPLSAIAERAAAALVRSPAVLVVGEVVRMRAELGRGVRTAWGRRSELSMPTPAAR